MSEVEVGGIGVVVVNIKEVVIVDIVVVDVTEVVVVDVVVVVVIKVVAVMLILKSVLVELVSTLAVSFCAGLALFINVVVLANFVFSRSFAVPVTLVGVEAVVVEVFSENWCSSWKLRNSVREDGDLFLFMFVGSSFSLEDDGCVEAGASWVFRTGSK